YYGAFINTIATFVIVALVMFYLVRVAVRMQKPEEEAAPASKECSYCLTEIPIAATRCPNCTSQLGAP
ncbi:MscL family protein, partial [Candidatus Bipolaricaulota bacterium]